MATLSMDGEGGHYVIVPLRKYWRSQEDLGRHFDTGKFSKWHHMLYCMVYDNYLAHAIAFLFCFSELLPTL